MPKESQIADALGGVANALIRLGYGNAATSQGAIELLGEKIADSNNKIAESIADIAQAIDRLAKAVEGSSTK